MTRDGVASPTYALEETVVTRAIGFGTRLFARFGAEIASCANR